ncbi:uncharacterized protein K460DRAFT_279007 [Cucurbitaria berberidis CBS 394.84]|uniref:Uncharacterized protein n=1 Tax=Cucurbitaria berberidis CBS 394.84 TaxID=1168544 RepID=A0A9P4GN50_9PLEO|nr:uncharacterized protein K460DRAFT_279007 [Cucurbitaria berberidis CBS 394.84]KAF1848247.1 hypothetical protein K460DRAFT_279007 [Cucurbitaria berberidis CBS 394.84]
MTAGIVRAVFKAEELSSDGFAELQRPGEPALADPKPGNPISHSQLIDLSKLLKKHSLELSSTSKQDTQESSEPPNHEQEEPIPITLNALLQNSTVYTPPLLPKKHHTPEYTALMARLRAQEESRTYERMLHPPPTRESFSQRFPRAPEPYSIGASAPVDEDEVSYEEVHRQIILIINVLVSIVAVAVFIWVAARHWSVGKRLGLSMGGSVAIAIAEVAVYGGYVRKVKEAKRLEKKKPEIKEIVKSWVIEKDDTSGVTGFKEKVDDGVRFRKGKHR